MTLVRDVQERAGVGPAGPQAGAVVGIERRAAGVLVKPGRIHAGIEPPGAVAGAGAPAGVRTPYVGGAARHRKRADVDHGAARAGEDDLGPVAEGVIAGRGGQGKARDQSNGYGGDSHDSDKTT